ncbi:integrase catalytic domain-containing protein [Trichonephila inaurata madagascariensis]|uniref:Integrase catalytic domain-containing protein n=1 Tax=Trichonephila inaurata madagascariensis TaxID=2747483 RepID=A0A8X6Y1D7_9ARAC|nr:integrase catalytic domain-containing protein [Trichonephila inaurata madagascariensis]
MNMRKFDTNSEELKNLWRNSNSLIEINENSDSYLKVLGLVWNNSDDTLRLDLRYLLSNLNKKECTKRNILHTAAKLFDPSGFVSPFLIRAKLLLQELWQLGVGWDEVVSGRVKENCSFGGRMVRMIGCQLGCRFRHLPFWNKLGFRPDFIVVESGIGWQQHCTYTWSFEDVLFKKAVR